MTACITCGSEPARDEARLFNIIAGRYTAIASKLAPTGGQQGSWVGAGSSHR
ncbi:hypothetical protein ABIA48_005378 [Pseudomonas sp. S30_BP2TU TE3576]